MPLVLVCCVYIGLVIIIMAKHDVKLANNSRIGSVRQNPVGARIESSGVASAPDPTSRWRLKSGEVMEACDSQMCYCNGGIMWFIRILLADVLIVKCGLAYLTYDNVHM